LYIIWTEITEQSCT